MSLPILIPAHNEAAEIGAALDSLPSDVDPIVLANGCEDETAEIAKSFGAMVLEFEAASKLRALQAGIKEIGSKAASGYVILDADTRVLSPNYTKTVLRQIEGTEAAMVAAPLLFRSYKRSVFTSWTVIGMAHHTIKYATDAQYYPVNGPHMMLKSTPEIVDEIVELPDFWPGEDRAILEVHEAGGANMIKTLHPHLAVSTSVRGRPSALYRIMKGSDKFIERRHQEWWSLQPTDGKVAFGEWKERHGIEQLGDVSSDELHQLYAETDRPADPDPESPPEMATVPKASL